jgi:gas vesicle protein
MSETPEELRAEIEATRQRLGTNVDAVADKVTPSHIVQRQTDKVKDSVRDAVSGVREKVMGAADAVSDKAHGVAGSVSDTAHGVAGSVSDKAHSAGNAASGAGSAFSDAPGQLKAKAQGNPLAAGLIAFGAGLLISSLIPASTKEREAAQSVKEAAEPLKAKLTDAAKDVAQELKEPAQDAVQSIKETATDAADTVKTEGQSAVEDVKGSATDAKDNVKNA